MSSVTTIDTCRWTISTRIFRRPTRLRRPGLGSTRVSATHPTSGRSGFSQRSPRGDCGLANDVPRHWRACRLRGLLVPQDDDLLPNGGRAGLVSTANVRFGDSRKHSLDYVVDNDGVIYEAVSSQPWSGDATVEVSIVNWTKGEVDGPRTLWLSRGTTKMEVPVITGSLSPNTDLRAAATLAVNRRPKVCFQGQTPRHTPGFVLSPARAAALVAADAKAANVIHPFLIGEELNGDELRPGSSSTLTPRMPWRPRSRPDRPSSNTSANRASCPREARGGGGPARNEKLLEANPNRKVTWHQRNFLDKWWELGWRRPEMVPAITALDRYIVLSRVAVLTRQSVYACVSPEIRPGRRAPGIRIRRRLQLRHSPLHLPPRVFRGALFKDAGRPTLHPEYGLGHLSVAAGADG